MSITTDQAAVVIAAGKSAATAQSLPPMNIAVVDDAAHLVAFTRMDGALLGTIDVAQKKARTAALFQLDSAVLGTIAQPGAASYTLEYTNGGLISFAGGIVLRDADGHCIGAVGVSGGTVDQDELVAKSAATALD
jgi:uncharacterized protein GlcG (DUF336 family)